MMRTRVTFGLAGLLLTLSSGAQSANNVMLTVKVSVVAPTACIINNNNPINVQFGDVITTRVDGNNYRVPIAYALDCSGASSNAMKLQVKGSGSDFNHTLLQTSVPGLGIQLQQGDSVLPINDWINFTYPQKPALWAVPVKQSGVALTGGEFTASATLKVDYQ